MILLTLDTLKNSDDLIREIRWDVTPQIFLDPSSVPGDEPADITHGYMLYVDLIQDRPALIIMQLRKIMSKTVGYLCDVPEDLMRDAMQCSAKECIAGMYPLGSRLESWLKKELGV